MFKCKKFLFANEIISIWDGFLKTKQNKMEISLEILVTIAILAPLHFKVSGDFTYHMCGRRIGLIPKTYLLSLHNLRK